MNVIIMTFQINTLEDAAKYNDMMCGLLDFTCDYRMECKYCIFFKNNCLLSKVREIIKHSPNKKCYSTDEMDMLFYGIWELSKESCDVMSNCKSCRFHEAIFGCKRIEIRKLLKDVAYGIYH